MAIQVDPNMSPQEARRYQCPHCGNFDHHIHEATPAAQAMVQEAVAAERERYVRKCDEIAAQELVVRVEQAIAAERERCALTDHDLYYLRSILGHLREVKSALADGPRLGGEVLADNIDWLDCFIDKHKPAAIRKGE